MANKNKVIVYDGKNDFVDTGWFEKLANKAKHIMEDFKAGNTEINFQKRELEIHTRHSIGSLLLDNKDRVKSFDSLVGEMARELGESTRQVQYCVAMVRRFPTLNDIPADKTLTFNKIKDLYLTNSGKKIPDECPHVNTHEVVLIICDDCGHRKQQE